MIPCRFEETISRKLARPGHDSLLKTLQSVRETMQVRRLVNQNLRKGGLTNPLTALTILNILNAAQAADSDDDQFVLVQPAEMKYAPMMVSFLIGVMITIGMMLTVGWFQKPISDEAVCAEEVVNSSVHENATGDAGFLREDERPSDVNMMDVLKASLCTMGCFSTVVLCWRALKFCFKKLLHAQSKLSLEPVVFAEAGVQTVGQRDVQVRVERVVSLPDRVCVTSYGIHYHASTCHHVRATSRRLRVGECCSTSSKMGEVLQNFATQ